MDPYQDREYFYIAREGTLKYQILYILDIEKIIKILKIIIMELNFKLI